MYLFYNIVTLKRASMNYFRNILFDIIAEIFKNNNFRSVLLFSKM